MQITQYHWHKFHFYALIDWDQNAAVQRILRCATVATPPQDDKRKQEEYKNWSLTRYTRFCLILTLCARHVDEHRRVRVRERKRPHFVVMMVKSQSRSSGMNYGASLHVANRGASFLFYRTLVATSAAVVETCSFRSSALKSLWWPIQVKRFRAKVRKWI